MCGIYCAISKHGRVPPSPQLEQLLRARGPDAARHLFLTNEATRSDASLTLFSTVLSLRGSTSIVQPLQQSDSPSTLCWNGEAWAIDHEDVSGNDTQVVYSLIQDAMVELDAQSSPPADDTSLLDTLSTTMARITGPYAFAFFDSINSRLYFGRDPLGRRSLLYAVTAQGGLILASVADAGSGLIWREIEPDGIYCVDLKHNSPEMLHAESNWGTFQVVKAPYGQGKTAQLNGELSSSLPLDSSSPSVAALQQLIHASLGMRLRDIPAFPYRGEAAEDGGGHASRIAILFSGGLDCSVIARIVHDLIPEHESVDLLNVAFENPRVHKDAGIEAYSLCPDRITALQSHAELQMVCPGREWRLVTIDVSYTESQRHRQSVIDIMLPHNTEMDLSIALALYFAARGSGRIATPSKNTLIPYTSSARVLLSGLGADELFAGYVRHATAYRRNGMRALLDELELDMGRLGKRNLGRDDRVMSHWGREVRFPYLDEQVVRWASAAPISEKCGFAEAANNSKIESLVDSAQLDPGKKVLRCLAWKLGMLGVAKEPKRAIQFGARTAKMDTGKTKGTHQIS